MISIGVNNASKEIFPNINNGFTPIKIGINNSAINVTKIFIGDSTGHSKEVYFNHLYDFRHSFKDRTADDGDSSICITIGFNNINDRDSNNTKISDMTFYISSNMIFKVKFDTDHFNSIDNQKFSEISNYTNITRVNIQPGWYDNLANLSMFTNLEYLEIPNDVKLTNISLSFNNSVNLKTVNIYGIIESASNIFENLYDGSAILCFNNISYNTIVASLSSSISLGRCTRKSVIYFCVYNENYIDLRDSGNIAINNGTIDDNKIILGNFITNFYNINEFDDILGETT